ncbi:MAG: hypothetical protein HY763_15685 [Planctomycetes bacterium]|nr:hypothetical protein [Planctomycetota bacterium]
MLTGFRTVSSELRASRRGWPLALALLLVGVPVRATPVSWTGTAGNWNTPANWSLNLVPNNAGQTFEVTIGSASHDVTVDISPTINTLANSGTLRLGSGFTLTLVQAGGLTNNAGGQLLVGHTGTSNIVGSVTNTGLGWVSSGVLTMDRSMTNNGTFWLGDGSFTGGTAALRLAGDAAWNGGGEVYFFSAASTTANQPLIDIPAGRTLTNSATHRIHGGSGRIDGAGRLVNLGLIDADSTLRTLRLDVDNFSNQGNLWARSGNLVVAVDDWANSGTIRVSSGSQSSFSGQLFTNEAAGIIESVGGADLSLSQAFTNAGVVATGGVGTIHFTGNNTLITNLPSGVIDATAGTVFFSGTNALVQNFGALRANEGTLEFRGGTDMFGGTVSLLDHSALNVRAGTTSLSQVHTTLDATSTLAAIDQGTGAATFTHNGVVTNNGGLLLADSDGGNSATFNLNGHLIDVGGTIRADGGDFNVSDAVVDESGMLSLELRNGGDIRFTNVDSSAAAMDVTWLGNGGSLVFDNYRRSAPVASTTSLDLTGWAATGGALTVQNSSSLSGSGVTALPASTAVTVSNNSRLDLTGLTQAPAGTLIDLVSNGRLAAANLTVDGELRLRGGTLEGNLMLNPSAVFTVNNQGTNRIAGSLGWVGNRTLTLGGGSAGLGIDGGLTINAGSGIRLADNGQRIFGQGTIVNNGLIEGGAPNTSNSTYVENNVTNNVGGIIRAFRNGAANNTFFQLFGNITNNGVIEADGANLYFNGADVVNNATLRATNNAAGSKLIFLGGATVTNNNGTTTIDGASSALEVSAGSNVALGTLTFANGGGGFTSDGNTTLTATNTVSLGAGSQFTVTNSSRFNAPGINLDGTLVVQNSAAVNAPITVGTTGQITANSSIGTLNGNVTVQGSAGNDGRISVVQNGAQITGTGVVTNSGLIEGGAPNTSNSTYFVNDLINTAQGIVRAFRNGAANNTFFQLFGNITNNGVIEADGANLYFNGADLVNNATLRAVNNAAGSKIIFLGGATVTNNNGTTTIDGASSTLEVSGGSNVALGTLTFANGAGGFTSDGGTSLTATNTVSLGAGSQFSVQNSSRFNAPGLNLAGGLTVNNSAAVNAPITVAPTGQITANSGNATLNGNVTVQRSGPNFGRLSLVQNGAQFNGSGVITNNGLIEGGAPNTSNSTFLSNDVVNAAPGVVRAFQNGAATNTFFQILGNVTNAGVFEAVGSNLYFNSADVANSGVLRAVSNPAGSKLIFIGGSTVTNAGGSTTVDGANSALEVSQGSVVNLGTLTLSNNAGGFTSDGGTSLTAGNTVTVGPLATFTVTNSSRFNAPGLTLDGNLTVQNSAAVNAPITVRPGAHITANSGTATLNGNVVLQDGIGSTGVLSLVQNGAVVNGTGVITNNGLIEGGAPSANNSTYLDSTVINGADGEIRAFRNGTAVPTYLQIRGNVTNAGIMEADAATLYFTGANVTNSGTIRARTTANSALTFTNSSVVTDMGGVLNLPTGSVGQIENSSRVEANTTVSQGATLSLVNSARLGGPGLLVAGQFFAQNSVVVSAPTTLAPTGLLTANSGSVTFTRDVTVQAAGPDEGRISIVQNSASVNGAGTITNSGIIEGGAPSNSNTTFLNNPLVNNVDGMVRAFSNNGATGTVFQLGGSLINRGLLSADAATLSFAGLFADNTGGMLSATNGGRLLFNSSYLGGTGGTATVNGDAGRLELSGGATVGLDSLSLLNGGDVTIRDGNSALALPTAVTIGGTGVATISNGGRWTLPTLTVNGLLSLQGGTVFGNVNVGGTGTVNASAGANLIDGDVATASGALLTVNQGGTSLVLNGALTNVAGATVRLNSNTTALSGTGLFTNAGLLEAGAFNNNSTVTLSKTLNNSGTVTGASLGGATNTTFQITAATLTNSGSITASGANVLLNGTAVAHSGTLRAEGGTDLSFQNSAALTNLGGSIQIDSDQSILEVLSSSNVNANSLSLTNGGDVLVQSATLNVNAPFIAGASSVVTVQSAGVLGGAGVQVGGVMNAGQSTINTTTTIGATGQLNITSSGTATFNAAVNILAAGPNEGRLSLQGNSHRMGGTGVITNSGIILGAAPNSGNSTFIDNGLTNNADGLVRAGQNGAATNTFLQFSNTISNAGIMEADGGNLYFTTGANVANSGTLRAVSNAAGSKLVALNAAQITSAGGGGTGELTGAASALEISSNADVAFGTLTFASGAGGFITGSGSTLSANNATLGAGSTFNVQSSALFTVGNNLNNSGTIALTASASLVANGPVTNAAGSTLSAANGTTLDFNSALTVNNILDIGNNVVDIDGDLTFGAGGRLRAVSGGRIRLAGDLSNASTLNTDFDSRDLVWELDRNLNAADPLLLEAGSRNLGNSAAAGLPDNFALGTLLISGADEFVRLVDLFNNPGDGAADALYVSTLTISDPDSRLTLNGLTLYYQIFNGSMAQIDLSLGGAFTSLNAALGIPEPATVLMMVAGCGVLLLTARGRRRGR